jgi:hypothetical protein
MYTTEHIEHLREQVRQAEEVERQARESADGWRGLLAVATACTCGMPGTPGVEHRRDGQPCQPYQRVNPYPSVLPTDTQVFPPNPTTTPFDAIPDPPGQAAAHGRFQELHDGLCGDTSGPEGSFPCTIERFHNSLCDDGNGTRWARQTQQTAGGV